MTVVTISKEIEFDAGHRVPNHESKCRHPHGHRYRVMATVEGTIVTDAHAADRGMVLDFGDLKRVLVEYVHDTFDHTMIVHAEDRELADALNGHGWNVTFVPMVPTAENLAVMIFNIVDSVLSLGEGMKLVEIAVWETPTSMAAYTGGGD